MNTELDHIRQLLCHEDITNVCLGLELAKGQPEAQPLVFMLDTLRKMFFSASSTELTAELVVSLLQGLAVSRRVAWDDWEDVPFPLTSCEEIQDLNCGNSPQIELMPHLLQFKNLKYLALYFCDLDSLPNELAQLQSLEDVLVSVNHLTKIPDCIYELPNLRSLNFSDNKITNLSPKLLKLQQLRSLYLSNNQLAQIPEWLLDFPNLHTVHVDGNPEIRKRSIPKIFKEKPGFTLFANAK